MNFSEQLNYYINEIHCSSKELSNASGLSPAVISRYRNGERVPSIQGSQLKDLSNGIATLAIEHNITNINKNIIFSSLSKCLNNNLVNFEHIRKRFNDLISILQINVSEMARILNFDASYFSRIRNGKRKPADLPNFIESVCNFVVHKYNSLDDKKALSLLVDCSLEDLSNDSKYMLKLKEWFTSNSIKTHNDIDNFLKTLDEFDLNEYIKVIHFDEMKVPSIPFYKHSLKTYYGLDEMKQGELDFFKSTVLSKSDEPVFMCSDMPMDDMAEDVNFGKKWMFAIAMCLKKGLHLNIIHNLDRPFNEMMLGIESWIPIYMTGQVSPYYLKSTLNNIYCHFNYVSGKVALTGECIKGFHGNGKYYLTTNTKEVEYYKIKSQDLLTKAQPLMEIYKSDSKNAFNSFLLSDSKTNGTRHHILSSLPIYTISDDLLCRILEHNNISIEDKENIRNFVNNQKNITKNILKSNSIIDEISEFSKENFENSQNILSLSECFYENKITYTYDEYLEHLNLTKQYVNNNKNYSLKITDKNAFKNIQINIHEGKFVIISKNTNPVIHFVIHHPKLRASIENFIAPIVDTID